MRPKSNPLLLKQTVFSDSVLANVWTPAICSIYCELAQGIREENGKNSCFYTLLWMKQRCLKCFLDLSKCRAPSIWALPNTINGIGVMCQKPTACLDLKNLQKNKAEIKKKLMPKYNCDSGLFFKAMHSNIYQGNRTILGLLQVLLFSVKGEFFREFKMSRNLKILWLYFSL